MKLNLGCADRFLPSYIGVDLYPAPDGCGLDLYQQVDLAGPWPWEDSSVDEALAFDVIEHVGDCPHNLDALNCFCSRCVNPHDPDPPEGVRHPIGRIHFLNELHRVLKPGARATIETPDASRGVGYFQDPTHVSPFCQSTFKYFEHGAFAHTRLSKPYGITAAFKILSMFDNKSPGEGYGEEVFKIRAVLEAVKP